MTPEDDDDLIQHIIDKQIIPQLNAIAMQDVGLAVDTAMVSTSPDAVGFEVACAVCSRTARSKTEPKGLAVCPSCVRVFVSTLQTPEEADVVFRRIIAAKGVDAPDEAPFGTVLRHLFRS